MKIEKGPKGVEVMCFGATKEELKRDLEDSLQIIDGFGDDMFARKVQRKVRRKKAKPEPNKLDKPPEILFKEL